ncbi:MarR family transcriptional regulator [Streptosporangiaceae bacterium NEAU-GS5]|nr:MarR family transcriptional regulator [Streptosporangiaceae bacterium NEAU-GS5]
MDSRFGLMLGGGALVTQVGQRLRTVTDAAFGAYDLTSQQAAVMLHVARGEGSPMRLAAQVGTDTAGMTRLLDRLTAKDLVVRTRHPDDRRSVVVELTTDGRALVPKLAPIFGQVSSRLLYGFEAEEIRELTGFLQRMLANLGDH